MDKRAKQTIAIGGLCGVIGLTLGMIIMAVWGPYAMERARQERNVADYQAERDLQDQQSQASVERSAEMLSEAAQRIRNKD